MTRAEGLRFAVVTLLWSFTWIVIRDQVTGDVPGAWSVAYRFLLAGGAMMLACVATGRTLALDARGHLFAAAVGLFLFGLNFNLVYEAERYVASGLPAVVFALLVVPNAVLARIVLGQRLDPRVGVGALLGIAGVALLFRDELTGIGGDGALGLGLTLAAVLCASVANVMQATPAGRRLPAWTMLAWAMLYGGAFDAVAALATAGAPPLDLSARYLAGTGYLALGASALAFVLYFDLIRTIGPARAAYTSLVAPFLAMAVSTLVEGYRWTPWAIGGAVLATAGIALALGGAAAKRPA